MICVSGRSPWWREAGTAGGHGRAFSVFPFFILPFALSCAPDAEAPPDDGSIRTNCVDVDMPVRSSITGKIIT
eukprot:2795572-Pleurochrysis_carterae.AAC.5